MIRLFIILLLGIACTSVFAQTVFLSDSSDVTFYSYAPLEDIKANSKQMNAILNTVTGEVAFVIPMRSFKFPKALMQEHFNEKYIESDKYPQATFTGKINDKPDLSKDGTYNLTSTGKFSIHGKEKVITEKGTLIISGQRLTLTSEFNVAIDDFGITKPQILWNNIADTINVKMKIYYGPYKKK